VGSPRVVLPSGAIYRIELARTPEEQQRGLMFRESLPERSGMLFLFEDDSPHRFWMKNTMIPLDMIWMDGDGRVLFVSANTPPCKADPCPNYGPDVPAASVLEIAGETTPGRFVADLTGAIRIFEQTGVGHVLAEPTVTVQSGSQGRVQLGEDFSVKQRTISGDITETFFSTGTIMEVLPKVYHYKGIDFVALGLKVERSTLIDPVNVRVAKTQTTSKKVLFDGEEDYVGGLFITSERTTREGIPLLKDIPIIKYLFSYEKVEQDVRELVVILRADLVPVLEDRVATKEAAPVDMLEQKLFENRKKFEERMKLEDRAPNY